MPRRAATPPFGPTGDGTVYLVMDCEADLQRVVTDLLTGRYRHPSRVVAFDTNDGSVRDITADCAVESEHELPAAVRDFLGRAGA
jgi:hypothetical protein